MGWTHRVREHHGFVVRQGIQEIIVALDERLLLLFVCFSSSSLRGIAPGLWYSRPRRCKSAISPERLSYTRPDSFSIQAPVWRVERGNAAPTHAFKSFSCFTLR